MLATYSPAATVSRFLKLNNFPQETWGGIVGISTGLVSEYLSGKKPLPGDVAERWLAEVKNIKNFLERVSPVPVNWHPRLASEWKKILRDFENNKLLVSVVDCGPESQVSPQITQAAQDLASAMETLATPRT